jgi:hypothetical protein
MKFFKNLPKEFIRSAVRQVGRDGGKVISNKVYKGRHGTPIYNSGSSSGNVETFDANEQNEILEIDMTIQPQVKNGSFMVLLKGVLIQIVPFGTIAVLLQSINYLTNKTADIYVSDPNRISDGRYKEGYRVEGSSIIKTKQKRILSDAELRMQRSRGIYYLISIVLFFLLAYLLYVTSLSEVND